MVVSTRSTKCCRGHRRHQKFLVRCRPVGGSNLITRETASAFKSTRQRDARPPLLFIFRNTRGMGRSRKKGDAQTGNGKNADVNATLHCRQVQPPSPLKHHGRQGLGRPGNRLQTTGNIKGSSRSCGLISVRSAAGACIALETRERRDRSAVIRAPFPVSLLSPSLCCCPASRCRLVRCVINSTFTKEGGLCTLPSMYVCVCVGASMCARCVRLCVLSPGPVRVRVCVRACARVRLRPCSAFHEISLVPPAAPACTTLRRRVGLSRRASRWFPLVSARLRANIVVTPERPCTTSTT